MGLLADEATGHGQLVATVARPRFAGVASAVAASARLRGAIGLRQNQSLTSLPRLGASPDSTRRTPASSAAFGGLADDKDDRDEPPVLRIPPRHERRFQGQGQGHGHGHGQAESVRPTLETAGDASVDSDGVLGGVSNVKGVVVSSSSSSSVGGGRTVVRHPGQRGSVGPRNTRSRDSRGSRSSPSSRGSGQLQG